MYEQLEIHYEGQTEFVATDQQRTPLRLFVTCPAGLEAGADVRVSISTFHSYSRKWTLADPFVEGGEGVVVIGHGLPRDWTDMDAGRRRPGRRRVGGKADQRALLVYHPSHQIAERGSAAGLSLRRGAVATRAI